MAGIYIKGMQMPTGDESLCIRIYPCGGIYDSENQRIRLVKAIPVPAHGRLIDADALCDGRVSNDDVVIHVKCAPTVIPADKEGEA